MVTYYLYQHIRLDNNKIFYIGVGTVNQKTQSLKTRFARAYKRKERNRYWKNITNKTDYKVEIIIESHDENFINNKEKELIKLYGRKNEKGSLANISEGGEKSGLGAKRSQEHCEKLSIFFTEYWKNNISPKSKKVYRYDLQGNLLSISDSLRKSGNEFNINYKTIQSLLRKNNKSFLKYGYYFSYEKLDKKEVLNRIEERKLYKRKQPNRIYKNMIQNIKQYSKNGNFIKTWNSLLEIEKELGFKKQNIRHAIYNIGRKGNNSTAYGFIWKF